MDDPITNFRPRKARPLLGPTRKDITNINCRMEVAMAKELSALAEMWGMERPALIRRFIGEGLANYRHLLNGRKEPINPYAHRRIRIDGTSYSPTDDGPVKAFPDEPLPADGPPNVVVTGDERPVPESDPAEAYNTGQTVGPDGLSDN